MEGDLAQRSCLLRATRFEQRHQWVVLKVGCSGFFDGRSRFWLVIIGLGALFFGWREWSVSGHATKTPLPIELSAIEAGKRPTNNHLLIGDHLRLYEYSLIYGKLNRDDVESTLYPIISMEHPFIQEMDEYFSKQETPEFENLPPPEIKQFVVLVQTNKYKSEHEIPRGFVMEPRLQGLVISSVRSLRSKEKQLIEEEFPNLDFDKLIVIEDEATVTPAWLHWLCFGIGSSSLSIAGIVFFMQRSVDKAAYRAA